jgi:hypothetical protein
LECATDGEGGEGDGDGELDEDGDRDGEPEVDGEGEHGGVVDGLAEAVACCLGVGELHDPVGPGPNRTNPGAGDGA